MGYPAFKHIWTDGIDAALIHPINKRAYFIKGDEYISYKFADQEKDDEKRASKPRRIGRDGFKGLWTDGIDAALVHPFNNRGYFLRGDEYMSYDFAEKNPDNRASKPRKIGKDGFIGVWSDVDAALVHPETNKGYFFKGHRYQRYNFKTNEVEKEGTMGKTGWKGF